MVGVKDGMLDLQFVVVHWKRKIKESINIGAKTR